MSRFPGTWDRDETHEAWLSDDSDHKNASINHDCGVMEEKRLQGSPIRTSCLLMGQRLSPLERSGDSAIHKQGQGMSWAILRARVRVTQSGQGPPGNEQETALVQTRFGLRVWLSLCHDDADSSTLKRRVTDTIKKALTIS